MLIADVLLKFSLDYTLLSKRAIEKFNDQYYQIQTLILSYREIKKN